MTPSALLQPGLNGAFVADGFGSMPSPITATSDTLAGKRLAVKDVFDIAGLRAGAGNLAWLDQQKSATQTALAVRMLLEEGASWIGKTVTDELTYSLAGINAHYGTPVNPAAADRIPGGSSSGSAVAVAAGLADIGLGTDCGGSIRLPASYCGVWGIRPTHGRIADDGCLTLAQSFDTVGWFARDAATLASVLKVLAHTVVNEEAGDVRLHAPQGLLATLSPVVHTAFRVAMRKLGVVEQPVSDCIALSDWAQAFRVLQGAEIAQRHGAWAGENLDSFGADVRSRFKACLTIDSAQVQRAQSTRVAASRAMARAFSVPGTYWVVPTLPWIAPRTDASNAEVDDIRTRAQQMLCIAGLAGLPQVNLPWTTFDGAPLGLSVIGPRGDDEGVLAVARAIHAAL
jgi:amidase